MGIRVSTSTRTLMAGVLAIASCGACATEVKLPAGTEVMLELKQNLTSGLTPAGAPVYFEVQSDVAAEGHLVIARGTLVRGEMFDAAARRMAGTSGIVNFGVRFVPAVDGQRVRVIASTRSLGRSRDNATTGWIIFWGVGGLMTHGANAHVERGAALPAQVLTDRFIHVDASLPAAPPAATVHPAVLSGKIAGFKLAGKPARQVRIDLERDDRGQPLDMLLAVGSDIPANAELAAVNGWVLPQPVATTATSAAHHTLTFDSWSIAQYCDDGDNLLALRWRDLNGATVAATVSMTVAFNRKQAPK